MNKNWIIGFISLALVLGMSKAAPAAKVANTSQLGSLLVFPIILIDPGEGGVTDTIIQITNTGDKTRRLKCYWLYLSESGDWTRSGFSFTITGHQPIWFSARSGTGMTSRKAVHVPAFSGPDGVGELKCWVVNDDGVQIRYNKLKGEANLIVYLSGSATRYNAWSFKANGVKNGGVVGTPFLLNLCGIPDCGPYYDACPKYLHFNFFAQNAEIDSGGPYTIVSLFNVIALTPCREDLRQGGIPTRTKLEFDIWDENETKYTGIWHCLSGWSYIGLSDLDPVFTSDFPGGLQTDAGTMRVFGRGHTDCDGPDETDPSDDAIAIGLIGVHISAVLTNYPPIPSLGLMATTPFGEGVWTDNQGIIDFDYEN